jgi:hypothetical protein
MKKYWPLGILLFLLVTFSLSKKSVSLPAPTPDLSPTYSDHPQFVVLSFDGSRSLDMWRETLDFAQKQALLGTSLKYTYFISGVYLIPESEKSTYQAPHQPAGLSKIGFGLNTSEIASRITFINMALADGHEIASHLNGHFPGGSSWSAADWRQELITFQKFINSAPGLNTTAARITGFRAPNLSVNSNLWPELVQAGFVYDAGAQGKQAQWPDQKNGLWKFYLPYIPLVGTRFTPLAMDYNFYLAQTNATDTLKQGTAAWTKALKQVTDSYDQYFATNYHGSRAPVYYSNHFSLWNDGLYWDAMQSFASRVCKMPDVYCVIYSDLVKYLTSHPSP